MNKKTRTILISVVVIIIIAIIILPKINSDKKAKGPVGGGRRGGPVVVSATVLKPQNLEDKIISVGTIKANEEVEVRSEISARIIKINFREGTFVNKGQLLIKLNDLELQAQLKKANSQLKLLQDREYRQRKLFEREAISQEEYDAQLNELNSVKADIDLIKAQIDKTEIKAPFSGKIGLRNVSEGSYVTPSIIITNLEDISPVKIDFTIPEKYTGRVKINDIIKFSLTGQKNSYTGKIYAIEPRVSAATRSFQLRGEHPNTTGELVPGSFVDVELVLSNNSNALLIPTQAMVPELKGQSVFVYSNGKAISKAIQIGTRTDRYIQVTSGLNENDTVITSGILQLKTEMPVKLANVQ